MEDLYLHHFRLRDKPFRLAHHPAYYYPVCHQEPLDDLLYSIEERQGLALLVGEAGTGKTSLLRRILQILHDDLRGIFIGDSFVRNQSLLERLASELGIGPLSEGAIVEELEAYLRRDAMEGKTTVVLVDEAQGLAPERFDELRCLSNLEYAGAKLLEIVLSGQPSIEGKLTDPALAALRQRIVVRTRIEPLGLDQTASYIEYRLRAASAADPRLFTSEAITKIRRASRGIPRIVNIVCDRSLLIAYVQDARAVSGTIVDQAVRELNVTPTEDAVPPIPSSRAFNELPFAELNARLDAIEKRLDRLIGELRRIGVMGSREW